MAADAPGAQSSGQAIAPLPRPDPAPTLVEQPESLTSPSPAPLLNADSPTSAELSASSPTDIAFPRTLAVLMLDGPEVRLARHVTKRGWQWQLSSQAGTRHAGGSEKHPRDALARFLDKHGRHLAAHEASRLASRFGLPPPVPRARALRP